MSFRSFCYKSVKFLIVGATNTVVSYLVFVALVTLGFRYRIRLLNYNVALALEYVVGIVCGYLMNRHWTFSAHGSTASSLPKYCLTYVGLFAVNLVLLNLLVQFHVLGPRVGQLVVLAVTTALSFGLQNLWVFKRRHQRLAVVPALYGPPEYEMGAGGDKFEAVFNRFWESIEPGARVVWRRFQRIVTPLVERLGRLPSVDLADLVPDGVRVKAPIREDILLAPYDGQESHDDYTALMKLVVHLKPAVVVELGTAYGNTAANICNHSPDSRIYTVDIVTGEASAGHVTAAIDPRQIGRVYRKYGFEERVTQVHQDHLRRDLARGLQKSAVDLAIIDAGHGIWGVVSGFFKIKRFVRAGGIILFHDTHPSRRQHLRNSTIACMMLRMLRYDVRHLAGTWWALWRRKEGRTA